MFIQKEEGDSTQIQKNVLTSETGESKTNQREDRKSLSCDGIVEEQQEIAAAQTRHTVESREIKTVFQGDDDTFRPFPTDKCDPNPSEVLEMRWTHSQDDMKSQKEDVGHEIKQKEVVAEKNIVKTDTTEELQHQRETLERTDEDMSERDKDERVSIRKLKIEELRELMGNVENPQGERKSAAAELKEQELSAEVESSPRVEYKKLSEGTKDPITTGNTAALEVIGSGLEEMFIERFGEDLVRAIWEEVFGWKEQASNRDTDNVDGTGGKLADVADITQDCHLLFEKDFNDDFDSGIFSLIELPTDPKLNVCQGVEQTLATKSEGYSPNQSSQSLTTTEQTHFLSETQADLNSSALFSQDLSPILAAQSRHSLTEWAQSSPKDQGNYTQIRERSVTSQETGRQIEDCVTHRESFNQSASHKHPSSSSGKLKESDSALWWSLLYLLSHITRLLICILLVAGFFFIVFLYDIPAFFVLYIFSLCWWFYKWKTHRVTTNKGIVG